MADDIEDLLKAAASDHEITGQTKALLTDASTVAQIKKGDGVSAATYTESSVSLVTILLDDSDSIFHARNETVIIEGHNVIIEALKGTKRGGQILVSCRYLNGTMLYPYVPLKDAVAMTTKNFRRGGITPLYDQWFVTLGGVMAKAQEFDDAGITCQTWTLVVGDGADYGSRQARAEDGAKLIKALNSEAHRFLAIGVSDGETDFRAVFRSMGLADEQIRVSTNDPSEIRAHFGFASQSAVAMNQPNPTGGLGGFGG